jgi:hypothetical protein
MTTSQPAIRETVTDIVEVPQGGALPDFMQGMQTEAEGISTDKNDILIPMARVLQPLSPQVLAGPNKIEGAESGDIYIRNAPQQIIKATRGFWFQSCYFYQDVVEWKPRSQGGGIVNRTDGMPGDASEGNDPDNAEKKVFLSPRGTVYVETRYFVGYLIDREGVKPPMPLYIPLASSGHTFGKTWMFHMAQKRNPSNGSPVPSWALYYELTTKMRTKNGKSWFMFEVTDAGPVVGGMRSDYWVPTKADFDRGKALHDSFKAGEVQLEQADEPAGDGATQAGVHMGDDIPF